MWKPEYNKTVRAGRAEGKWLHIMGAYPYPPLEKLRGEIWRRTWEGYRACQLFHTGPHPPDFKTPAAGRKWCPGATRKSLPRRIFADGCKQNIKHGAYNVSRTRTLQIAFVEGACRGPKLSILWYTTSSHFKYARQALHFRIMLSYPCYK